MRGRTPLPPPPPPPPLLLFFFLTVLALQAGRNDAQGMEVRVQALLGEKALLPCDVTPPSANDTATLVIWFKDEITPIYSYDARGKFSHETEHWKQRHVVGERASFETAGGGATAALTFRRVVERDQGVYRCRVDFRQSPSRNTRIHLTVVVPPQPPVIHDPQGPLKDVAGPYEEGSELRLACLVSGGRPPATVRWLRDGRVLEAAETRPDGEGGPWSVRSLLVVAALTRADLHATLTCRASNSPLAPPVEATVRLDLYLRPLWASIVGERIPLSAGRPHDIQCRSAGSRPPANITWWIDNAGVDALTHKVSPDLNETVSTLRLTAGAGDHDRVVTCRAENRFVRGGVEEDSWRLDVYFMPMVQLHLGPTLDPTNINEGGDVYFECKMQANPAAYKVVWSHNGEVIVQNTSAGVIASNQHLALRAVTRRQAGRYSCTASNVEGDGRSNVVHLAVKYKPVCQEGGELRPATVAVALGERATVNCSVDALPAADSFRWSLGNSSYLPGLDPAVAAPPPPDSGAGPSLQLIPVSPADYGTLLCWASNAVGMQAAPCVFHIVPAGKPDPPSNCTLVNQTSTSLQLECMEGFDGGRQQRFELLVEEVSTGRLVANLSSRWPTFGVAGLRAGQALRLTVSAVNSRGRSMPVALDAYTLKAAELRTGVPVPFELTPILSVLLSVATVLLLAVAGIVGSQRVRSSKQRQQDAAAAAAAAAQQAADGALKAGPDVEEPNPDLIPPTRGALAAGATPQDSPGNDAAPRHAQLMPAVAAADHNGAASFYQAPRLWTLRQTDEPHIAGMKVLEPVMSGQPVLDHGRSAAAPLSRQLPQKPRDLVAVRRGSTVATELLPEDSQQESCV